MKANLLPRFWQIGHKQQVSLKNVSLPSCKKQALILSLFKVPKCFGRAPDVLRLQTFFTFYKGYVIILSSICGWPCLGQVTSIWNMLKICHRCWCDRGLCYVSALYFVVVFQLFHFSSWRWFLSAFFSAGVHAVSGRGHRQRDVMEEETDAMLYAP